MHLLQPTGTRRLVLIGCLGLAALAAGGCENGPGQAGGVALFRDPQAGREQWAIRCTRITAPNHRESARFLADLLGKVQGLRPGEVRVVSDAEGSTIYYGRYVKEASPDGGLVFPKAYQRDIELIRSLTSRQFQSPPFLYAAPEMISSAEPSGPSGAAGDIATAKGSYSLLIAVFYNTPEFTQRKEAAEAWVKDLRERGYAAYYYHEPIRSFVYVGDFDASDLVQTRDGRLVYGPRVEELIARNPQEFQRQSENGLYIKRTLPDGTTGVPPALLLPVPGRTKAADAAPTPYRIAPGIPQ